MSHSKFEISIPLPLLKRLKNGDLQAYEQLYKLFEVPVYNLAFKITQCKDDAADILQETFIQIFRKIRQFKGNAPFWAWVRKISINTTIQSMRNNRRNRNKTNHISEHMATDHYETIEPLYCSKSNHILQALKQLPVETRAVVWLFDVEGFTHHEIAQMTQQSISYSKSQLSRAHKKLRQHLEIQQQEALL